MLDHLPELRVIVNGRFPQECKYCHTAGFAPDRGGGGRGQRKTKHLASLLRTAGKLSVSHH